MLKTEKEYPIKLKSTKAGRIALAVAKSLVKQSLVREGWSAINLATWIEEPIKKELEKSGSEGREDAINEVLDKLEEYEGTLTSVSTIMEVIRSIRGKKK